MSYSLIVPGVNGISLMAHCNEILLNTHYFTVLKHKPMT